MKTNKTKKVLLLTLASITTAGAVVATVFAGTSFNSDSIRVKASEDFEITLDSTNSVNTAGTITQKTKKGNDISFTYSGVTSSSGNHTRLNQNGYIVNAEQITSIEYFTVVFTKVSSSASLTLKSSYDGKTWGTPWEAESGHQYSLDSNPYYIQLTAVDGAIDIKSVDYIYSCSENPAAAPHYAKTWTRVSSNNELANNDKIVVTGLYNSSAFTVQNALETPDRSYWLDAEPITLTNSNTVAEVTDSNDTWTLETGTTSGKWKLRNGSTYLGAVKSGSYANLALLTEYDSAKCDWTFTFNGALVDLFANEVYLNLKPYSNYTSFEFSGYSTSQTSSYPSYIFKSAEDTTNPEYDKPVDLVGFEASDSNALTYMDSDVYDLANGLNVVANYSDGTRKALSKGGTDGYSYILKNSEDVLVDSSSSFGEAGSYKVVVSYKDFTPIEISITVSETPDEPTYADATMSAGTNAEACQIIIASITHAGIKAGTSKNSGSMTISIPKGATKLRFYAAGWNSTSGDITLTADGFTISPSTITPSADSGISKSSPFTLSGNASDFLFNFTLTGVTSASTLTLTRSNRFVVWGAQVGEEVIDPTGITLSDISVGIDDSKTITPTYIPETANHNKEITWSKVSGSSTISVDQTGKVTVTSGATTSHSAVIKAELTNVVINNQHPSATCTVTVTEVQKDAWTLLFYVCGSNLESASKNGGAARDDLQEILSVRNSQPDSVNIVVETGGATKWYMPNVNSTELGRWEINSSCTSTTMNKVASLENASMGETSTFQDFLEWGVTNYPAEKYGIFMWNHGGAIDGCCFDDNFSGDGLTPREMYEACSGARSNLNMTSKFEFVAYDACLMAVQDIALFNAHDFNYQISSQETEWSGGYDYGQWLPTLYADPYNVSTVTVLSKIGDTFMDYYENRGYNDQTQSVYDLNQMSAYKTAFDSFTDGITGVVNSSSKWTTFANNINKALKYGYDSDYSSYNGGYTCDVFDIKGAMNALKNASAYSTITTRITAVLNALDDVVVYNRYGSDSSVSGSCGMNLFCPLSGYNQVNGVTVQGNYYPPNYDSTATLFSKWQAFVEQYGSWYA